MRKSAKKELPNTIGKVMSLWTSSFDVDADPIEAIDFLYNQTKHDSWWFSCDFDAWARDNKITVDELCKILKDHVNDKPVFVLEPEDPEMLIFHKLNCYLCVGENVRLKFQAKYNGHVWDVEEEMSAREFNKRKKEHEKKTGGLQKMIASYHETHDHPQL